MSYDDNNEEMFIDNSMIETLEDDMGCLLCEKNVKEKDFPKIVIKALSRKYCSNLNSFFYTKDINKILNRTRCKARTQLKEWLAYDFENEYCKRYYEKDEFDWKFRRLNVHYERYIFVPKVYIKEVIKPTRRFYYYKEYLKRYGKLPMMEEEYDSETESESEPTTKLNNLRHMLKDMNIYEDDEPTEKKRNRTNMSSSMMRLGDVVSQISSDCFTTKSAFFDEELGSLSGMGGGRSERDSSLILFENQMRDLDFGLSFDEGEAGAEDRTHRRRDSRSKTKSTVNVSRNFKKKCSAFRNDLPSGEIRGVVANDASAPNLRSVNCSDLTVVKSKNEERRGSKKGSNGGSKVARLKALNKIVVEKSEMGNTKYGESTQKNTNDNSNDFRVTGGLKNQRRPIKFYQVTPEKKKLSQRGEQPGTSNQAQKAIEQIQSSKETQKLIKKFQNSLLKKSPCSPNRPTKSYRYPKTAKIVKNTRSQPKLKKSRKRLVTVKKISTKQQINHIPGIKNIFFGRKKRKSKTKKKKRKSKDLKQRVLSIRASLNKLERNTKIVYSRNSTTSLQNYRKMRIRSPILSEKRHSVRRFRSIEKLISRKNSPFKSKSKKFFKSRMKKHEDFEGKLFKSTRNHMRKTSRRPSRTRNHISSKKKLKSHSKNFCFRNSNSHSMFKQKHSRNKGHSRNLSSKYLVARTSKNRLSFKKKKSSREKKRNPINKIFTNLKIKNQISSCGLHDKIISKILRNGVTPRKKSLSRPKKSHHKRKVKTLRNSIHKIQDKHRLNQLSDINILRIFNHSKEDLAGLKNIGNRRLNEGETSYKKFQTLQRLFQSTGRKSSCSNQRFFKKKRSKNKYVPFTNLSSSDRNSLIFSLINRDLGQN